MTRAFYTLIALALFFDLAFGGSWCPLFQLEKAQAVSIIWNFDEAKAVVRAGDVFGVISPFAKRALVGDEIIPLADFPRFANGDIWVGREFLEKMGVDEGALKDCAVELPSARAGWGLAISRIVLDPGHGGKDMGVLASGVSPEKELVLKFAKSLRVRLEEQGFWVMLTRDEDVYRSLAERAEVANRARADLFISLHFNGWEDEKTRGFEIYYPSSIPANIQVQKIVEKENLVFGEESKNVDDFVEVYWRFKKEQEILMSAMLANLIERSVGANANDVISRGVNGAPFFVLVKSPVPAVLIEFGYLTNPEDAKLLLTDHYRDALLDAVVQAVCAYDIVLWLQRGGGRWRDRTGAEPTN